MPCTRTVYQFINKRNLLIKAAYQPAFQQVSPVIPFLYLWHQQNILRMVIVSFYQIFKIFIHPGHIAVKINIPFIV